MDISDQVPAAEAVYGEAAANEEKNSVIEAEVSKAAEDTAGPGAEVPAAGKGKRKKTLRIVLFACLAALLVAGIIVTITVVVPVVRYSSAEKAFASENYKEAWEKYEALGDYKDAPKMAVLAEKAYHYSLGKEAFDSGDYDTAHEEYLLAGNYEDAKKMAGTSVLAGFYSDGMKAVAEENYEEAIEDFRQAGDYLDAAEKVTESFDLWGDQLLEDKEYTAAAECFAASGNAEKRIQCGILLVSESLYEDGIAILQDYDDEDAAAYMNYANAMLCIRQEEYENAIDYLGLTGGLFDTKEKVTECTFNLAEQCLHEGYLNKAKALYETLPEDYALNGQSAADRVKLLNENQKFLDLVGSWKTLTCMFRVQADSTTSSYYYYWYQDELKLGYVTVMCPYNDDGTFSVTGTATYPTYTNFSTYSSNLKMEMKTFSFNVKGVTSVPYSLGSSSTCSLVYGGNQFTLKYKYVDEYSNVYWHYTFTSNNTYGSRAMLSADKIS